MNADTQELALKPWQLRRRIDPDSFSFQTTADVEPLDGTIGQPRAMDALEFGLEIDVEGFNLYISGRPGSGRESTVNDYLKRIAPERPTPPDWVYVQNFANPERPQAISLPAGTGRDFAQDMDDFVQTSLRAIPRAFESEDYERRQRDALADVHRRRETITSELHTFASERGFSLQMTQAGIISAPTRLGVPLTTEDLKTLPDEERQGYSRRGQAVQERIEECARDIRSLEKEAREIVRQVDRAVVQFAVGPLLEGLRKRYSEHEQVITFLDQVQAEIADNVQNIRHSEVQTQAAGPVRIPSAEEHMSRFRVNLFVDHRETQGAPVLTERNPSYYNLFGRIDYRSAHGTMMTDFSQVRSGALHQANGGFLIIHAPELFQSPKAWETLKRALLCREIRIENLGEQVSPLPTSRLRPEPIPLEVKIVIIGPPALYYQLHAIDNEFEELFRVKADFAADMDFTNEHVMNYARFVRRDVERLGLRHFDASAIARIIEYGARLQDHQHKLSTRLLDISHIIAEASFWAGKEGQQVVQGTHVDHAIEKRAYRANLAEERTREVIADGTITIDVDGSRIGQINGLAVLGMGDFRFGKPNRITAQVSLGQRGVQSIERETQMSGSIHSKGVLTLTGYLAGQYAQDAPLVVGATITFEQSYGGIDGDSASSAELYALLSAISDLPLRQDIAVTGSVDQYGQVQAVGGVTHKIEGFFKVCRDRGLTGTQGVMIPATNVKNLMLSNDVVEAVENGQFTIWAVETIDQGIELLTGSRAGVRDTNGRYPDGTVHQLVEDSLERYADTMRRFGAGIPQLQEQDDVDIDDNSGDSAQQSGLSRP